MVKSEGWWPMMAIVDKVREKSRKAEHYKLHADELRARQIEYYKQHAEHERERSAEYRRNHPKQIRMKQAEYLTAHAEEEKARKAKYYRDHIDEIKQRDARYLSTHKTEKYTRNAEWRKTHAKEMHTYQAEYRKTHPEKTQAYNARHRALKRNAPICDFTEKQWIEIKAAYKHRCAYCGRKMERLAQDHVIPLSKGGPHTASNIIPACKLCNSKKSAKTAPIHQPMLTGCIVG